MNAKLSGLIFFAVGAVCGAAVTQRYFKKSYEKISREEIEEVRNNYKNRIKEEKTDCGEVENECIVVPDSSGEEYANIVASEGYVRTDDNVSCQRRCLYCKV